MLLDGLLNAGQLRFAQEELLSVNTEWLATNSIPMSSEPERDLLRMNQ